MLTRKSISLWFAACAAALTTTSTALAQQQQVFLSEPTDVKYNWSTAPILTRNEPIPLLGSPSSNFVWDSSHIHFDGLGAFRRDADTLTVYVNHENSTGSVSRVDLNVPLLQTWITNRVIGNNNSNYAAKPAGLLEGMSKAWTSVAGPFNQNMTLAGPCSGNAWEANTFGPGRGFTDRLYLTGEETFASTGHYWALETATNTLYQAPAVGGSGSWESATVIDTGRTDTIALLLGEDRGASTTGTARLSLYVGAKDSNSSDFLVRNGLVGGKTYYWDANGTANTNGTLTTGGLFANNNDSVLGTWTQSTTEAVLFSKAEDVHTNMQPSSPKFGKEAVLASQDQAIFQIDFSGLTFTAGDLTPGSISSVKVLFKNGTEADPNPLNIFNGFDNLVWSADGNLYVNEDDGEGDIWQVNVAGLKAQYQLGNLNPSLSNVFQILDADSIAAHTGGVALGITESSGIIDISSFVGYAPGSIFLADGQGSSGDQLVMLVSPTASVIPEPSMVAGCLVLVCGAALYRRRAGRNG